MAAAEGGEKKDAEKKYPPLRPLKMLGKEDDDPCVVCLEERGYMFVVSCCGQWIHPHCLERSLKEFQRCPHCRQFTREACTVQTRKVYERLKNELGPVMTGRVHQDVFGYFSLEYGLLRMTCGCFCNEKALIRLRFECGLNDFITAMKAMKCIHILPLDS